jgi:tRNA threonylcarbamoyladenosine biosynthesis protein TsaE
MSGWPLGRHDITDPAATRALAGRLADPSRLRGRVIYLHGELGAGKTTLVRDLLHALGVEGRVKSPTYGLLESYRIDADDGQPLRAVHLDLYRLQDPEELEYLALRELQDGDAVLLVEWPERGRGVLPDADLHLRLALDGERRVATVEAAADRDAGRRSP